MRCLGLTRIDPAKQIFEILRQSGIALEPEIFKIELIGQVGRVRREEAMAIYEEISKEVKFVEFAVLTEVVLDVL